MSPAKTNTAIRSTHESEIPIGRAVSVRDENQDSLKVYEIYRDRIKHSDILISHRVGYFLLMQSAIVTAIKAWRPSDVDHQNISWLLDPGLPVIGWVLAFALLVSVTCAFWSIEATLLQYDRVGKSSEKLPGVRALALAAKLFGTPEAMGVLPPLRSGWLIHVFGHAVPWFVTLLSLLTWPFFVAHAQPADIFYGHVNGYWYLFEALSLGAFALCLGQHVRRCRRNDNVGVT